MEFTLRKLQTLEKLRESLSRFQEPREEPRVHENSFQITSDLVIVLVGVRRELRKTRISFDGARLE